MVSQAEANMSGTLTSLNTKCRFSWSLVLLLAAVTKSGFERAFTFVQKHLNDLFTSGGFVGS